MLNKSMITFKLSPLTTRSLRKVFNKMLEVELVEAVDSIAGVITGHCQSITVLNRCIMTVLDCAVKCAL